jgi:hypothetical protein
LEPAVVTWSSPSIVSRRQKQWSDNIRGRRGPREGSFLEIAESVLGLGLALHQGFDGHRPRRVVSPEKFHSCQTQQMPKVEVKQSCRYQREGGHQVFGGERKQSCSTT